MGMTRLHQPQVPVAKVQIRQRECEIMTAIEFPQRDFV